jgi:Na+/melibiose symporter-like transporter
LRRVVFPFLDIMGFDATGQNNTPENLELLGYVFGLGPVLPFVIAALLIYRSPLGHKEHAELRRQLDSKDAR